MSRSLSALITASICLTGPALWLGCGGQPSDESTDPELASGSRPGAPKRGSGDRPNVLLISIDTLRPDRLGCYGHDRDTSPTLDRLAAEGVLFEDVTSASPWTLPSHASLLTGLYPSHHGVKNHNRRLADTTPSLATLMGAAGYETMAVVNSHNVSERYGLNQGFKRFQYVWETNEDGSVPNKGAVVLRRAESMLGEYQSKQVDRPFFMFLHMYDVHSDFIVGEPYREQYVRPYDGQLDGGTAQLVEIRRLEQSVTEDDVRFLFDLYDGEIRQLDDLLGKFFGKLYGAGLFENTYIAIVSDHGEEFFEHGSVLHGRTYYQEVMRIPWILRGPGLPAGTRFDTPVHLVDVAPTLLNLVGIDPSQFSVAELRANMDGLDLGELVRGGSPELPDRLLFAEADHHNSAPDIRRLVRTPRYKLLYDLALERAQLFDIEGDPLELTDLYGTEEEIGAMLLDRLLAFMAGESEGEMAETIDGPSADVLRQLEQLGY